MGEDGSMGDSATEEKTTKKKPGPVADRGAPPPKLAKRYLKNVEHPRIVKHEAVGQKTRITLAIGRDKGVAPGITGYIPHLNNSRFTIESADAGTSTALVDWPYGQVKDFSTALVGR